MGKCEASSENQPLIKQYKQIKLKIAGTSVISGMLEDAEKVERHQGNLAIVHYFMLEITLLSVTLLHGKETSEHTLKSLETNWA